MIIQYALIALMAGVLLYFLAHRGSSSVRAWKKAGLAALILLGVVVVVHPSWANRIAHAVGVGRGADLLLYGTVVAFVFVSVNVYLKFKDVEARMARVAREVALLEAQVREASGQR